MGQNQDRTAQGGKRAEAISNPEKGTCKTGKGRKTRPLPIHKQLSIAKLANITPVF
jgi:hypothetical protein